MTRRDRIGGYEDVGHEVHHEVEDVAGPVRLQPHDVEPPCNRAVGGIDDQRYSEPHEHGSPMLTHGLELSEQGNTGPKRREDMNAKSGGAPGRRGGRNLSVGLFHVPRSAIRNRADLYMRPMRRTTRLCGL